MGSLPLANIGLAVVAFVSLLLVLLVGGIVALQMSYSGRMCAWS